MQIRKKSPANCWNNLQGRSMNVLFINTQLNDDTFKTNMQEIALERICHHGKRKCRT